MVSGTVEFMRGLLSLKPWWQLWVTGLMVMNMVIPLAYLHEQVAVVTLATFMVAGILGPLLTWWQGFTRLLGLMHFPWLVLVPWLMTQWSIHPADDALGVWIRAVVVINSLSLVIDVNDVARFIRGDRSSLLPKSSGDV